MLSVEENLLLTRVGPGTPGGELMRRYWHPIAASLELDEQPTKPVRILGEDLVLFKDRGGRMGLIDKACPHRRVDMRYGIPEDHGLRCPYHGWLIGEAGQCLEIPADPSDSTFRERVAVKSYPVQELGGLIFAYLGPAPAPALPRWDLLVWDNVYREIGISVLPCNWLQCQENSLDSTHLEWDHQYFGAYMQEARDLKGQRTLGVSQEVYRRQKQEGKIATVMAGGSPSRNAPGTARWGYTVRHHTKLGFDIFDYGIYKRRCYEGTTEEDAAWKRGHPIIFPNILRVGNTFQFRVPMDDSHTFHILYTPHIPPEGVEVAQTEVPYYEVPVIDKEKGWFITDWIFGQDFMAWATQGLENPEQGGIAQRNLEKLAESDKGIVMFRRLLKQQINRVQDGGAPIGSFQESPDFIPVVTETIPPPWVFKDEERGEIQTRAIGEYSTREGARPRVAAENGYSPSSGQLRFAPEIDREVQTIYAKGRRGEGQPAAAG